MASLRGKPRPMAVIVPAIPLKYTKKPKPPALASKTALVAESQLNGVRDAVLPDSKESVELQADTAEVAAPVTKDDSSSSAQDPESSLKNGSTPPDSSENQENQLPPPFNSSKASPISSLSLPSTSLQPSVDMHKQSVEMPASASENSHISSCQHDILPSKSPSHALENLEQQLPSLQASPSELPLLSGSSFHPRFLHSHPYIPPPTIPDSQHEMNVFLPPWPGTNVSSYQRNAMPSFVPVDEYSPFSQSGSPPFREFSGPNSQGSPTSPNFANGSSSSTDLDNHNQPITPTNIDGVVSIKDHDHSSDAEEFHTTPPIPEGQKAATFPRSSDVYRGEKKPPSLVATQDNLDGLVSYLWSQFGNPAFTDAMVELRHPGARNVPTRFLVHALLIGQSPTLRGLMRNIHFNTHKIITIETNSPFINDAGFELALQRLYGCPLLPLDDVLGSANFASMLFGDRVSSQRNEARMVLALGYTAAGHLLGINSVIRRGIQIASHLVSWQTLENLLSFVTHEAVEEPLHFIVKSGINATPSTFDDNRKALAIGNFPTHPAIEMQGKYPPFTDVLFNDIVKFVIVNFPRTFTLLPNAKLLSGFSGLPWTSESSVLSSNTLLNSIRFGDHPYELSPLANICETILSRILVSIPFDILKLILESEHLCALQGSISRPARLSIAHAVIQERESRRKRVLNSKSISNSTRNAKFTQWDVVGWEESIVEHKNLNLADQEPIHKTQSFELVKKWKGFHIPTARSFHKGKPTFASTH